MRVVFMGTQTLLFYRSSFAHDHQVALVITRPDAVRGGQQAVSRKRMRTKSLACLFLGKS